MGPFPGGRITPLLDQYKIRYPFDWFFPILVFNRNTKAYMADIALDGQVEITTLVKANRNRHIEIWTSVALYGQPRQISTGASREQLNLRSQPVVGEYVSRQLAKSPAPS